MEYPFQITSFERRYKGSEYQKGSTTDSFLGEDLQKIFTGEMGQGS